MKNPRKAFGPVATGCVSLASGLTLSVHIARRGETPLHISQILFMNLMNCQLPAQVFGRNIVAMDRGYWGKELIEYLSSCGFQLIGTHKRVGSFPFTFGKKSRVHRGQKTIAEEGAKSVYWAHKMIAGKNAYALTYRDGKGHAANLFTTIQNTQLYTFEYVPKRGGTIYRSFSLQSEIDNRVVELTQGQGGVEWHIIRASSGSITSTVASKFIRLCQSFERNKYRRLVNVLGLNTTTDIANYTEDQLKTKSMVDL